MYLAIKRGFGLGEEKLVVIRKKLSSAADRALAEAEIRRKKEIKTSPSKEIGGREGPDPIRYGDWEKNGLAIDF